MTVKIPAPGSIQYWHCWCCRAQSFYCDGSRAQTDPENQTFPVTDPTLTYWVRNDSNPENPGGSFAGYFRRLYHGLRLGERVESPSCTMSIYVVTRPLLQPSAGMRTRTRALSSAILLKLKWIQNSSKMSYAYPISIDILCFPNFVQIGYFSRKHILPQALTALA